jgi:hypothetical protein
MRHISSLYFDIPVTQIELLGIPSVILLKKRGESNYEQHSEIGESLFTSLQTAKIWGVLVFGKNISCHLPSCPTFFLPIMAAT